MSANFSGILQPPFVIPEIQGWQGYTVLGLIGFMLLALVAELAPPYLVMMGTLVILLALSILDVNAALHGFADEAMLSVAVLFVVAKGLEQSGGLEYVASVLFRTPDKTKELLSGLRPSKTKGSIVWVLLKFCVPVAIFSAFLANIPLVAMMIPPILAFGKKVNLPPSKMLMPLSYAAQLGGTMTLIGASTNLVVLSMAAQKLPEMKMNLFEIGIIGVPVTIAGIFYIIAFSGKLLPDRLVSQPTTINAREYNVVLVTKPTSSMARKSIEKSGINRQPGLTLLSIDRDGTEITSPTPDFVLQPKDRLHFVGVVDSVLLLVQLNGLALHEDEGLGQVDLNRLKTTQCLVEAVVASESPMVHKRVADLQFRERYKAAVVAIHRYETRLCSAIGDIKLEAGDCLLLAVDGPEFVNKHRNNSTFALVAQLPGFRPINRRKAVIAAVLVLALVVASGVGVKLITAALFSAAGLLITKCLSPRDAMESIELPVLIMIAAAFGIAEGMVESGAATMLAKALMGLAGKSLFGLVTCTYVATTFFSLAITNSAAVTIMFPVALAAANQQKLDFRPFAYILMMAASAGFMTPTACPTNLMVYTPGNYKFSDFVFYGGPMQILLLLVTVGITMTAKYWFIWWIVITLITVISIPLIARHKSTHPKRIDAPAPASSPPDVKPSTSESDAENPIAALNARNADSSSFVLNSTISTTGDRASSSTGSSNSTPISPPISSLGASGPAPNKGSEELRQISGPSCLLMTLPLSTSNNELLSTSPTSQDFPLSNTASSSRISNSLLDSSSLPLSTFTLDLLPQETPESTEQQRITFPATSPSWSASVTMSPSSKPSPLPPVDISWPKPSILISEAFPSRAPTLTTQITPSSGLIGLFEPPTSGPETLSFKPGSLQPQITPSPGPLSLQILSTPNPGAFLTGTASLPPNKAQSVHPASTLSTPAASTKEIEPSSRPKSMPTRATSETGHASKFSTSPIQQPSTIGTAPKPNSVPGTTIVDSFSFLFQSSTQGPGPSLTKTASLPVSTSSSSLPLSTPMSSLTAAASTTHTGHWNVSTSSSLPLSTPMSSLTPAASTTHTGHSSSLMPLVPLSKPTRSISGQGTVVDEKANSPPHTAVAIPTETIPRSGAVGTKHASLQYEEPPFLSVTSSIRTIPGPGIAAAKSASSTHPEPPSAIPLALPVPFLPGPGTASTKRASFKQKRPSLMGQEKHHPIPPLQDTSKGVVETSVITLTDRNSQNSSSPIVVISHKPKPTEDLPLPMSGSKNKNSFVDGEALENGRGQRKSLTTGSEPSKPEPLFFTTTSSSKPPRRLNSPPGITPAQLSSSAGDPNKRRPSKIVEDDLTGGISDLMIPRRLSSINDVDAFADRWQRNTT